MSLMCNLLTTRYFRSTCTCKYLTFSKPFCTLSSNVIFLKRHGYSYNPFSNKSWFLRVCSTSLLKTLWEKEKLLVTSNFSFFHSVFYPFKDISAIFIKFEIVVSKLSVWKSLKFVVRVRVKRFLRWIKVKM